MKILFLDVDGVLNHRASCIAQGLFAIGTNQKEQLARIIKETAASIVLSSSWRLFPDHFAVISKVLKEIGADFIGNTPVIHDVPRSDEIAAWMEDKEIDNFAILDDDEDAGMGFEAHFFKTHFNFGLTVEIADKVIKHLNLNSQVID